MMRLLDSWITEFDRGLKTLFQTNRASRPLPRTSNPSHLADKNTLSEAEKKHSIALMRINHVGEVCAQALYQAQSLTTQTPALKTLFTQAAREEEDHLSWTAKRLDALQGRPSWLNPFWYSGAFAIGIVAGLMGDRISLGFMAETERQVEKHLASHLENLPENDWESRAIVEQMRVDEEQHAHNAEHAGGEALPEIVRQIMNHQANIMRKIAFYI